MAAAVPEQVGRIHVDRAALSNGLEIYVYEDHAAPLASVHVWYRVGSRDEPPGSRGMAHLLEHMMFKGSARVGPEEHARRIQSAGGTANAFTTADATVYWNKVPSSQLALAMALEAERMARLSITPEHLAAEREVVKEEVRARLHNDPIGAAFDLFHAMVFSGTPYAWTPAGTLDDLDRVTVDDLRGFYRKYYVPNNAVLVVAGDATIGEVAELARRTFGPIPPGDVPSRPPVRFAVHDAVDPGGASRQALPLPVQVPGVIVGFPLPGARGDDRYALEVAASVLAGGQSARLHQRLVKERQVAVYASAGPILHADAGALVGVGFFLPPRTPAQAAEALLQEIARLGEESPTEEEMEVARNQAAAGWAFRIDSLDGVANLIGSAVVVEGSLRSVEAGIQPYLRVTPAHVQEAARRYLKPARATVVTLSPARPGDDPPRVHDPGERLSRAPAHDIRARELATDLPPIPDVVAPRVVEPARLPPIAWEKLPNGLEVVVVERHERPLAYVLLSIPAGDVHSPPRKPQVATLVGEMLTKGTRSRSAHGIARAIESVGGSLSTSVEVDRTTLVATTLASHLPIAIQLMADVVQRPTFPAEELAIVQRQVEASLKRQWSDPGTLAALHARQLYYGDSHPLGHFHTPEEAAAASSGDLAAFHRARYTPSGSRLVVSGDVDPAAVLALARREFGAWRAPEDEPPPAGWSLHAPPLNASRVRFVEWPGQTQVRIELRQPGPPATAADWVALSAANYVLGGGAFASRLMQSIRARLGSTYDVHSYYERLRSPAAFVLSTYTRTSEVWKTLDVLRAELNRFHREGVTLQEVEEARSFLALGYPAQLETLAGLTLSIDHALYLGRGLPWVSEFPVLAGRLTQGEIDAAIRRYLDPNRFAVVLLGDPEALETAPPRIWGVPLEAVERVSALAPPPATQAAGVPQRKEQVP